MDSYQVYLQFIVQGYVIPVNPLGLKHLAGRYRLYKKVPLANSLVEHVRAGHWDSEPDSFEERSVMSMEIEPIRPILG